MKRTGCYNDDVPLLEAEIERLRGALAFYADESNWADQGSYVDDPYISLCFKDYGARAKAALAGTR